jgi:hypothetical protein
MKSGDGRGNLPMVIAFFAAVAILAAMFLPWLESGYQTASFVDLMSGTYVRVGLLTAGMLIVGAVLAVGAAGSHLLNPSAGRGTSKTALIGFTVALGGLGLWFVFWDQVDKAYGWTGLHMGIGVLVGIAAAVAGLVASIADFRSAPRLGMASPQAGVWSAPATAQLQPPMGWPGTAPTQVASPQAPWNAAGASGRISYVEGGHPLSLVLSSGQQVMVGRGATAGIRLSDAKVSREHATIAWSGSGWVVRDLKATNPTSLLGASGAAQPITGEVRMSSGQLLIGEVLVTLFPAGS